MEQNPSVAHSHSYSQQIPHLFIEPESSVLYSKELANRPCPQPHELTN